METENTPSVVVALDEPEQVLSEDLVNVPGSSSDPENTSADRVSELFPRNLNSLFSSTPALFGARSKPEGLQDVARSLAVAGSSRAAELDLDRMQVVVRVRPQLAKGIPKWSTQVCVHAVSSCSVAIAAPEESQMYRNGSRGQTYTFSRVFPELTTQQEYFQATAAAMVHKMVRTKQHSSVMMAYGISASGKTHTIEGSKADPGVLPQALRLIFKEVADSYESLGILVQNYEVYNEIIFDLLDQHGVGPLGQRQPLRVSEDASGQVMVAGLIERQRAATALSYSSSRSHSIFTITICRKELCKDPMEPKDLQRLGKISFVDLAGSERATRTGNMGARLKESVAINSSLMTLGRCLEALRWNQQHASQEPRLVPYRESKVTHIFRDVLHGWGQILLSVNISPDAADYDETAHVLRYAALATQISNAGRARPPLRPLRPISPNITRRHVPAAHAVQELQKQVQAAEERAALAETVIREEVSAEMGDLLREMEATYKDRLAAELGQAASQGQRLVSLMTAAGDPAGIWAGTHSTKTPKLQPTRASAQHIRQHGVPQSAAAVPTAPLPSSAGGGGSPWPTDAACMLASSSQDRGERKGLPDSPSVMSMLPAMPSPSIQAQQVSAAADATSSAPKQLLSRKATRTATSLARSAMLHNSLPFLATHPNPAAPPCEGLSSPAPDPHAARTEDTSPSPPHADVADRMASDGPPSSAPDQPHQVHMEGPLWHPLNDHATAADLSGTTTPQSGAEWAPDMGTRCSSELCSAPSGAQEATGEGHPTRRRQSQPEHADTDEKLPWRQNGKTPPMLDETAHAPELMGLPKNTVSSAAAQTDTSVDEHSKPVRRRQVRRKLLKPASAGEQLQAACRDLQPDSLALADFPVARCTRKAMLGLARNA
ncbi:hypothetical protein WJX84_010041 [Apatococcus fuscideae]|uniref:Kinesin-like protein n=1 Tax=Apatococcus fuscideae TaxID=2026836 RepID=A0AAW1S512_9CHLO